VVKFKIISIYLLHKSGIFLNRVKKFVLNNTRQKKLSGDYTDNHLMDNHLIISQAANKVGVSLRRLPDGYLELKHNEDICYSRSSDFGFENLIAYKMCGNKHVTSTILSENRLPVPNFSAFSRQEVDSAIDYFLAQNKPVVVKPASGTSSGIGISIVQASRSAFVHGFAKALCYSNSVMVEEYVEGESYRFTVLDGEVLTVVQRIPACVVADGVNTIGSLISLKNKAFFDPLLETRQFEPITVDGDVRLFLRKQGLTLKSIPEKGMKIELRRTANASQGGEIMEVTNQCHGDYLEMAVRADNLMKTTLSGVDMIIKDVSRPFEKGAAYINEVNTTPGLRIVRERGANGELDIKVGEEILAYAFNLDLEESDGGGVEGGHAGSTDPRGQD